jgi:pyrroloquinoline quinone biosynthesis protein A
MLNAVASRFHVAVSSAKLLRYVFYRRILARGLFDQASKSLIKTLEVKFMKWEKPSYTDLRFGFEVTMYIYNR